MKTTTHGENLRVDVDISRVLKIDTTLTRGAHSITETIFVNLDEMEKKRKDEVYRKALKHLF